MAVNSAKREIDHVTSALGAKKAEGVAGEPDVLDSEEHQLLQTLKAAKMKFRRCFPFCCIVYNYRTSPDHMWQANINLSQFCKGVG